MRYGAVKYTHIPIIVSNRNDIIELVFAISDALSLFLAHIFCHTKMDAVMESPIAGIIIT